MVIPIYIKKQDIYFSQDKPISKLTPGSQQKLRV